MDITTSVEDNSNKVLQELNNRMPELLNAMGNELYKSIYNFMTEDKIVDTGRLRGSISYSTPYNNYNNPTLVNETNDFIKNVKEENTIIYGSNVPYASYVNSGTTKQRARKFIEVGTSRATPNLKKVSEIILKGGDV